MIYIGIDPGVSGGIAAIDQQRNVERAIVMPSTDADILAALRHLAWHHTVKAVIEDVHASPQMGVVSAYTFGGIVRALRMALTAADIPFHAIRPGEWQRALGCLQPKGAARAFGQKDKNITKRRAIELFPAAKVTHSIADALLLAEYCRLLHTGGLDVPSTTATEGRDSGHHGQKSKSRKARVEGF